MFVYDCNAILTDSTKNRSDKEITRLLTKLTGDLKIRRINPVLNFMDNESTTALKTTMTTMDIKYELVTSSNHS